MEKESAFYHLVISAVGIQSSRLDQLMNGSPAVEDVLILMILLEKIVLSKLIELGVVIVSWEEVKVLKPAENV